MDVDLQLAQLERARRTHAHGSTHDINIRFVRFEYYDPVQCVTLCIAVATVILTIATLRHYSRHRAACVRGLVQTRAKLLTCITRTSESYLSSAPAADSGQQDSQSSTSRDATRSSLTNQSTLLVILFVLGLLVLCGVNATLMLMRYTAYRLNRAEPATAHAAVSRWDLWSQIRHADTCVLWSWLCEYVGMACTSYYLVYDASARHNGSRDSNAHEKSTARSPADSHSGVATSRGRAGSKTYIYGVLSSALSLFPSFYQSLHMRSDDPERGAVWTTHAVFLCSTFLFVALVLPWMRHEYRTVVHHFYTHVGTALTRERQGMRELVAREKRHRS